MNDKDKEQYNFWLGKLPIAYRPNAYDAWQSACEYKQKEIEELKLEIMQIKAQRNQAEFKLAVAIGNL